MSLFEEPRTKRRSFISLSLLAAAWLCALAFALHGFYARAFPSSAELSKRFSRGAIGRQERELFLSEDELVAARIYKSDARHLADPEITFRDTGLPGVHSERAASGDDPEVLEGATLFAAPRAIADRELHAMAREYYVDKNGYTEEAAQPLGFKRYPAYRYCKKGECPVYIAMGVGAGVWFSLTINSQNPSGGRLDPDSEKLGFALEAALSRVEAYRLSHIEGALDPKR